MIRRAAGAAIAATLLACGGEEPPQKESPAPPAETQAAPAQAQPAAAPEENNIGKIPLLGGLPGEGTCTVQEGMEMRLTFATTEMPHRTVRIGLGPATRAFAPTFLEVKANQPYEVGVDEEETIYVIFSPSGDIDSGTRSYSRGGTKARNESAKPLPDDAGSARQLAQQVADRCKPAG